MQDLSVEALKVLKYSLVNILGGGFFHRSCRSREFITAISFKKDSITELFLHGSCEVALFKLSRNFLLDIFAKHFLTKSQASIGYGFIENNVFDKNI